MDEMSNIEARRDFNVANLRRALGHLELTPTSVNQACPFADLLRRLAARDGASSQGASVAPGWPRAPTQT